MSGLGIRDRWRPLSSDEVAHLPATLGVFEIADEGETVKRIGFAGGRTLFGLRSAIADLLAEALPGDRFRIEQTMQYTSRFKELLMDHVARHGALPPSNPADDGVGLGRLGLAPQGDLP